MPARLEATKLIARQRTRKRTRPTTLVIFALVLGALAAASCAPETSDEVELDESLARRDDSLYAAAPLIWPSRSIPVCWENSTAGNATERLWVKQAVQESWSSVANVDFTGWGACSPFKSGVHILIDDSQPLTKGLGWMLNMMPDGMVLNFSFANWGESCQSSREYCIRTIAVHEFGHALGFAHEQDRSDTPSWCEAERGFGGNTVIGAWDLNSVMNYCNPKWAGDGRLSETDIQGVRQMYGERFHIVVPTGGEYQDMLRGDPGATLIPGDYNGDGRTDFIRQEHGDWDDDTELSFSVYFSRGNGYFNMVTPVGGEYQDWLRGDPGATLIPGDYNGDGRTDFIRQEHGDWDDDTELSFSVYFSRGNGYFNMVTPVGGEYQDWLRGDPGATLIPGDYNGDGRTDFIRQEHGDWDDDTELSFSVYFSRGNGYFNMVTPVGGEYQDWLRGDAGATLIPGDYNGDGRTDFIRQEHGDWDDDTQLSFSVYFSRGNGYFDMVIPVGGEYQDWLRGDIGATLIPGDFNGDGYTDFIRQEHGAWDDDTDLSFSLYFSRGTGYFDMLTPRGDVFQDWLRGDPGVNLVPGDYDGNGLTDFIRQEHGAWDDDEELSFAVYFTQG